MCAQYAATSESSNNAFIRIIGLILSIGAAVAVAVVIIYLMKLNLTISSGPLFIFVLVDVALVALSFFLFISDAVNRNNILRFISFALVGLMLFVNMFLVTNLEATDDFIGETFGTRTTGGMVEYSIIAQRTSSIKLSTQKELLAGIQSSDPFKNEAERETKKLAAATFEEFRNVSEIIGATEERELDIGVIQSALLDAYAEYFPDEFENLDILATFQAGTEATTSAASNAMVDITKPFSVFVSGIDTEGDISKIGRSDANMLILIDPENYKMMIVSTPRDYYVQLYGTSGYPDKLSHAGMYGIDVTERTIGQLYDIEIDYHVQINFTTITTFVQSLGGIVVDNPREFKLWGQTYKEGQIYLNGDQALLFARARTGLAEGDLDRIKNQQLVLEGIITRVTDPKVVVLYKGLISHLSGTFLSNIPPNVITQLFNRQITLGGDWSVEKFAATGSFAQRPTYSMGSQELSVVIPDQKVIYEIQNAIDDFMKRR